VLFKEESGLESTAQIQAFKDTWDWDKATQATFEDLRLTAPIPVQKLIQTFYDLLGPNQMTAYLVMMTTRLLELHRVLKPTGSLYLHCDPTASHYLKIIMDTIFGVANFRSEITWKRANAHNDPKRYGHIADILLYYGKTANVVWNPQYTPYRDEYYRSHFKKDSQGRFYRTMPLDAPRHGEGSPTLIYEWKGKLPAKTRTWAISKEKMAEYEQQGLLRYTKYGTPTLIKYADEMPGVPLQNIWTDLPPINPVAKERLGYPTQKPLALLERIIQASSNAGDWILDPFCGCGTAIVAAQKFNRNWVGIDNNYLTSTLQKNRLWDTFQILSQRDYLVKGDLILAEESMV